MDNRALAVKLKIDASFKRRGITFAIFSGTVYGFSDTGHVQGNLGQ